MQEANISVADFVDGVLVQVNAVPTFDKAKVAQILSDLQIALFSEVIRMPRRVVTSLKTEGNLKYFSTAEFEGYENEQLPAAEDVILVCAADKGIHFSSLERFYALSIPVCCRMNEKVYVRNVSEPSVSVHYVMRPAPIRYNEVTGYAGKICIPEGYISLLEAGVLAELYRHVGNADACRRHSEKYNALLESMQSHYRDFRGGDGE